MSRRPRGPFGIDPSISARLDDTRISHSTAAILADQSHAVVPRANAHRYAYSRRMDIAGAVACVHAHASVRVSIRVRESRATRISTREQQETRGKSGRARDLLRFCGASPDPFGRNILCRGN